MPKAAFLGSRVTAADRKLARTIRSQRSGHCDNVHRYLNQLDGFMKRNRFPDTTSNYDILEMFATQWIRKKRGPATINNVLTTL